MPKLIQKTQQNKVYSLLQSTQKRFLSQISKIRQRYQLSQLVLVLDRKSAKILASLFTMTQLVNYGITFLQNIQVIRKSLNHHAVYFITPTELSVDRMLSDFQQQNNPKYRKAHVLFTSFLDKTLMKKISQKTNFIKKLGRHSFKQFYCEIQILSDNCVHFDLNYLDLAYGQQSNSEKQMRLNISKRFIDLIASFSQIHSVRLLFDNTANQVGLRLAENIQREIKLYLNNLLQNKSPAINHKANDITIVITDRSLDVVSPLLHSYSYQALIYDLLGEQMKQQLNKRPKNIFNQFRYRHISHAQQELPGQLEEIVQKIQKISGSQVFQMKKMIELKQELTRQIEILHEVWQKFKMKEINEIGQLQLSLATGINDDGKQTSSSELYMKVITIIKQNNLLNKNQKLRLALITLACIKLCKQDYQNLLSFFDNQDKVILRNIVVLGVGYDKKIGKSTKSIEKHMMQRAKQLLNDKSMPSERYMTKLQTILPKLIQYEKEVEKQKNKMMQEKIISVSSQKYVARFSEKRLICFVAGGISQSQICSIRRNNQLNDVIIASDKLFTPNEFVDCFKKINILNREKQ